jgi:hypothetical protein
VKGVFTISWWNCKQPEEILHSPQGSTSSPPKLWVQDWEIFGKCQKFHLNSNVNKLLGEHAGQSGPQIGRWCQVTARQLVGDWSGRGLRLSTSAAQPIRKELVVKTCFLTSSGTWRVLRGSPVCLLLWQPKQQTRKNLEEIALSCGDDISINWWLGK